MRRVLASGGGFFTHNHHFQKTSRARMQGLCIQKKSRPVGFIQAALSIMTDCGSLSSPVFASELGEEACAELVNYSLGWLSSKRASRTVLEVPEYSKDVLELAGRLGFRQRSVYETLALELGQ